MLLQSGLTLQCRRSGRLDAWCSVRPDCSRRCCSAARCAGASALAFAVRALPLLHVLRARGQTPAPARAAVARRARPDGPRDCAPATPSRPRCKMVGDEMPEPIGSEFRTLYDEINYGVSMQDALLNLAGARAGDRPALLRGRGADPARVGRQPGRGARQHQRASCASASSCSAQVRMLSAEGRLSAWMLALLPFAHRGADQRRQSGAS